MAGCVPRFQKNNKCFVSTKQRVGCLIFAFIFVSQSTASLEKFPTPGSSTPMIYDDAVKFCSDRATQNNNITLAFPHDQEDENKLIKSISFTPATMCRFIYFGYKASPAPRYISKLQEKYRTLRWMLVYTPNVKPDLDPAVLSFSQSRIEILLDTNFNASKRGQNLLMLSSTRSGKDCHKHPYKCAYIYQSNPTDDFSTAYKRALQENPNFYTIVLYDPQHPPENLEVENFNPGHVLVSNVTYSFEYKFYNKIMRYQSSRFSVKDPEYDCLAYDRMADRLITYHCDDLACPACVSRITAVKSRRSLKNQ